MTILTLKFNVIIWDLRITKVCFFFDLITLLLVVVKYFPLVVISCNSSIFYGNRHVKTLNLG